MPNTFMRQFSNYPIYINHPGRWEEVRMRQRVAFVDMEDYKMMTWLDYTGKRLYEIMEDKNPRSDSIAFENDVYRQLQIIYSTDIGRLLFDSLNRNQKYWIVPLDYLDKTQCACGAYVFPGQPKEGGGVRLYYNPTDFNSASKRWMGADDILFHELVHAYRNGQVGYDVTNSAKPVADNENAEEFFALQMQNVYLACRGATRFYRTYKRLESVSKSTAYQYLVENVEAVMALRHFAEKEPLAKTVSRWMKPPNSFNPWRDHLVLERLYISRASLGMSRLPPF